MSFAKLVSQATDNEIALRELEARDGQLTMRAYLEACAAVPGVSAKEAEIIEKALTGHEGELLGPSFRRMLKAIRDFRRTGPILKLSGYMNAEGDSALGRLGCSRQSLFFAAARAATKQPELFGTMTKPDEFAEKIAACLAKRVELLAAIEASFTPGDLLLEENGVRFRIAPCIAVAAGFAERLVNFLVREADAALAA